MKEDWIKEGEWKGEESKIEGEEKRNVYVKCIYIDDSSYNLSFIFDLNFLTF